MSTSTNTPHVMDCCITFVTIGGCGGVSLVFKAGEGLHWIHDPGPMPPSLASALDAGRALVEAGAKAPAFRKEFMELADKVVGAQATEARKYTEALFAAHV